MEAGNSTAILAVNQTPLVRPASSRTFLSYGCISSTVFWFLLNSPFSRFIGLLFYCGSPAFWSFFPKSSHAAHLFLPELTVPAWWEPPMPYFPGSCTCHTDACPHIRRRSSRIYYWPSVFSFFEYDRHRRSICKTNWFTLFIPLFLSLGEISTNLTVNGSFLNFLLYFLFGPTWKLNDIIFRFREELF